MGCFLGCFKNRKPKKQRYKVVPRDQKPKIKNLVKADESLEENIKENPSNPVPELRGKTEAPLSLKSEKKVTFDANVTTYKEIQVFDNTESLFEKNETFSNSIQTQFQSDANSKESLFEKKETFSNSVRTRFPSGTNSKEESVVLSAPNYRYGNCLESDDEVEDLDYKDNDLDDDNECYDDDDDDDDDGIVDPSMESRLESAFMNAIGSNRNARDRSDYVLSLLNPVENLTQWKALKSKGATRKPLNFNGQKENSSLIFSKHETKNQNQETTVDASLSNWLSSLEKHKK